MYNGVLVLKGLFNEHGLRTFQDLKECYSLLGSSHDMYHRLRSTLHAYGAPWENKVSPIHLVNGLMFYLGQFQPFIQILLSHYKQDPVIKVWDDELSKFGCNTDWIWIWEGNPTLSKNPLIRQSISSTGND